MSLRRGVLVALVALAACGSSSGMAAPARCGPSEARTLAADRVARVYYSGGAVYGCTGGGRKSYRLGASARSIREGRVGPVALAGAAVAYGLSRFGVDTVSAQVVVRNLSDGSRLHSEPATIRPPGPEHFQSVAAVVVRADGAVAWIGQGGSLVRRGGDVEVGKADAHGRALLDSGSGIDQRSLGLRGSSVTWRHGGATRSARLY